LETFGCGANVSDTPPGYRDGPALGCTLPVFLALVGAALGADKLEIFVAYGVGMALVLMALAVAVACARQGVAIRLRRLLPHVGRLAGVMLAVSGGYLVYYWRASASATA
jgi:cytochrome c biogenesis protein CcdA